MYRKSITKQQETEKDRKKKRIINYRLLQQEHLFQQNDVIADKNDFSPSNYAGEEIQSKGLHHCVCLRFLPDSVKIITQISTVQAVILSSQLKELLRNVSSQDASQGKYKPIKLVYHPREPFFVIKQVSLCFGFENKFKFTN